MARRTQQGKRKKPAFLRDLPSRQDPADPRGFVRSFVPLKREGEEFDSVKLLLRSFRDAVPWLRKVYKYYKLGLAVVALPALITGCFELIPEAWDLIPRKYTQLAPICKYVTFEPYFTYADRAKANRVEISLDRVTVAVSSAAPHRNGNALSRPSILVLKNYDPGIYDLRVRADADARPYRFYSRLRLVDDFDFYGFQVTEKIRDADKANLAEDQERDASVAVVQPRIIFEQIAAAGMTVPECSTMTHPVTLVTE
jgi:hypothetical protein